MLDLGSSGSILTGITFCYWNFLFSRNKASDANIGIIAILVHFEKTLLSYNFISTDLFEYSTVILTITKCYRKLQLNSFIGRCGNIGPKRTEVSLSVGYLYYIIVSL